MMYTRRRKGTSWSVFLGVFGLESVDICRVAPARGASGGSDLRARGAPWTPIVGCHEPGPGNIDDPDSYLPAVSDVTRLVEDGQRVLCRRVGGKGAFLAFDRATELEPRDSIALSRGARALLNQNKSTEGLERAQRAYSVRRRRHQPRQIACYPLADWNNQFDAAIAAGARAIAAEPTND